MSQCPHHKLREGLPPLTERMKSLPIDERGYPIPFFVAYLDGKPDFRLSDPHKIVRCINEKLCWVCGGQLGRNMAFAIGPMCSINRISSEPPGHTECTLWSMRGCPFLARPNMVRREDDLSKMGESNVGGIMIARNPGVMAVWVCRMYHLIMTDKSPLMKLGEPLSVEWFREGRLATREEVLAGLEEGLTRLFDHSDTEEQRQYAIKAKQLVVDQLVPKA